MRIKRLAAALALAGATSAQAASGVYSGIWQDISGLYVFVMHNGDAIIATTYHNLPIPARDVVITLFGGQRYRPGSLDVGDLLSGPVSGNFARITGIAAFRTCVVTYDVVFHSSSSATMRYVGSSATQDGAAQGINCPAYFQPINGLNIPITKLF